MWTKWKKQRKKVKFNRKNRSQQHRSKSTGTKKNWLFVPTKGQGVVKQRKGGCFWLYIVSTIIWPQNIWKDILVGPRVHPPVLFWWLQIIWNYSVPIKFKCSSFSSSKDILLYSSSKGKCSSLNSLKDGIQVRTIKIDSWRSPLQDCLKTYRADVRK